MADTGQNSGPPQRTGKQDAAQLTGIGAAGGLFSGMFGVGGGTVMVPLLVFLRGFGEKRATGTSLMAIVVIAIFGVIGNQLFGEVDYVKGVLIGIPALGGVCRGNDFPTTAQRSHACRNVFSPHDCDRNSLRGA